MPTKNPVQEPSYPCCQVYLFGPENKASHPYYAKNICHPAAHHNSILQKKECYLPTVGTGADPEK